MPRWTGIDGQLLNKLLIMNHSERIKHTGNNIIQSILQIINS